MNHVLTIEVWNDSHRASLICSCGAEIGDFEKTTLDELNRRAHEHITDAERVERNTCNRCGTSHSTWGDCLPPR